MSRPEKMSCVSGYQSIACQVAFVTAAFLGTWLKTEPSCGVSFPELLNSLDVLETVAGTAMVEPDGINSWLPEMEGQLAIEVELSRPHMTMADWHGNLYIADKDGHAIRKVTPDGRIHTVAGTNVGGFDGDGPATEVSLNQPNGLYTFPNGVTYVLDTGNNLVRKISLDGQLTTIVEDPYGIGLGRGLWVSPDETTIYYAAGFEIRRWTSTEGVTIFATGFVGLGNLTVDPRDGELVATDREGHAVYKVQNDGSRTRIAGNEDTSGGGDGFPAASTGLNEVRGIDFHRGGGYFLATHDGGQLWFVDDADVIHLLIDGDDEGSHAGDGQPLTTPGRKISELRAVTLSPQGDLLITEHDGGYVRRVRTLDPFQIGDFDWDHDRDALDIDRLSTVVHEGRHLQTFDLTFDGRVDESDRTEWVNRIRNTYFGDANLDGQFSSSDLVHVFQQGTYEDDVTGNAGWSEGDFDGNGDFDTRDFVVAFQAGGYEQGPRPEATAVPESVHSGVWALNLGALCWGISKKRRLLTAIPIG